MKFSVIAADPPWTFTTYSDKANKSAKSHYDVMTTNDIASIPVHKIADDNAILLLWATWPNLFEAKIVGEAWGFTYKTLGFDWVKRTTTGKALHTGLGYYTRSNSEPCLLFRKGKMPKLKSRGVHSIIVTDDRVHMLPGFEETIEARISSHSKKPELFYSRVEKLLDGPYVELFSRAKRPGWSVIGNEIDKGLDVVDALNIIGSMKRGNNV